MLHTFYCVQDQLPPFRRVGVVRLVFFLLFFFLDKKETKNQESLIPPHRQHGIAGFQASRAAPKYVKVNAIDLSCKATVASSLGWYGSMDRYLMEN